MSVPPRMYPPSFSNAPSAFYDQNSSHFLHSPHNNRLSHLHYEQSFTHHPIQQHSLPPNSPAPLTYPSHTTQLLSQSPYTNQPLVQSVYHPQSAMPTRSSFHPLPQPLFNDSAFSADPRSNPHFMMTTREQILPLNRQAADLVCTLTQSTLFSKSYFPSFLD